MSDLISKIKKSTDETFLRKMANSENKDVLIEVAKNPHTPIHILEDFSNREGFIKVYKNETTNKIKISDSDWQIRMSVVQNPNISPTLLNKMATDFDFDVRKFIAQSAKTTPTALLSLSLDEDEDIRATVAQNINTSIEVLTRLALDDEAMVRNAAKENPNIFNKKLDE